MRAVRWLVWAAALASGAAGAVDAGSGLVVPGAMSSAQDRDGAFAWPSLRGRFSFGFGTPAGLAPTDMSTASPSIVGARLLGDYYFSRPAAADGRVSGFRATSGLLIGSRLGAWAGPSTGLGATTVSVERRHFGLLPGVLDAAGRSNAGTTVPYLGIGYSDAFGSKGRWGLSADLGLMALRPGSGVRLGRAFGGGQNVDDTLRDLRLAPVLQLGVSYSF